MSPTEAEDALVAMVPLLVRESIGLRRGDVEPPRLSNDFLLSGECDGIPEILIDIFTESL